jgi:glycosyltransferase involved in cell wall biosynthesis
MNVMYISYDGMTDPLGQSQVIPYLSGLSKEGYKINLISCEKQDRFKKIGAQIKALLESNGIEWFPVPYSTSTSVFSKQLNLKALEKESYKVYGLHKPLLVHCRSYMAALIGLKLKKKFGIKFIFDMRGFWANERIDGSIWRMDNFIHRRMFRYFKKKEIEFLKHADYVISLTENAKSEMLSWDALQNNRISVEVIPCCADLNLFTPSRISQPLVNELKKELNIQPEDFIISYLGSTGTWYMLEEMLDFFNQLLVSKPQSKFLFITADDKQHILDTAKAKLIPTDKIVIRAGERKEVPSLLSLSSLALYFIKPLYSKKASSPTKTGEIMGMGIPLITNSGIGDSDRIIQHSSAGLLIKGFNEAEYKRIIEQIDGLLKLDKQEIQKAAMEYFSLQKGIELYAEVYKKTLNNKI